MSRPEWRSPTRGEPQGLARTVAVPAEPPGHPLQPPRAEDREAERLEHVRSRPREEPEQPSRRAQRRDALPAALLGRTLQAAPLDPQQGPQPPAVIGLAPARRRDGGPPLPVGDGGVPAL